MKNLKNVAGLIIAVALLTACGSSRTTNTAGAEAKLNLLTADQVAVLASGAADNVVRDDVDGGVVARL